MLFSPNMCLLITLFPVLHPCHKLEYFKKHNWEDSWVQTARDIVRDEFDRSYAPAEVEDNANSMETDTNESVSSYLYLSYTLPTTILQVSLFYLSKNIFDDLPKLAPVSSDTHDELDRYLATDIEDGLMWWYERCTTFPHLSRMARDYLSIPGK